MIKIIIALLLLLGFLAFHFGPDILKKKARLHDCQRYGLSLEEIETCAATQDAFQHYSDIFFENWRQEFRAEFLSQLPVPDRLLKSDGFQREAFKKVTPAELVDAYDVIYNGLTDIQTDIEIGQFLNLTTELDYRPPSFGNFGGFQIILSLSAEEKLSLPLKLDRLDQKDQELLKKYCVIQCPGDLYGQLVRLDDRRNPGIFIMALDIHALQFPKD